MLLFQTHYQQGLTHVLQQLMLVSCETQLRMPNLLLPWLLHTYAGADIFCSRS